MSLSRFSSKFLVFLFLIFGILSFYSSRSTAVSSANQFSSKEKGFSITFPKTWTTKEELQGTAVIGFSPKEKEGDPFLENVNVVMSKPTLKDSDVQKYFEMNLGPLSELEKFKEIQRGETKIEGKKSIWIVFTHQTGGIDAKAIQYYLVRGTRGYVITGTALSDTFEKNKAQFEQIAKSFKTL